MTALSSALTSIAPLLKMKPRRRPVARTSFILSDRNAFEEAANLCLEWMSETAGADLPAEALALQSFDLTETTKGTGSAIRLDDEQGSIWAAQLHFLGDPTPERVWSTDLFVERRHGSLVRFGAQLICECGVADPGFEHSRPRIVKAILSELAAEADGVELRESVTDVEDRDVEAFAELIYRPDRRLPVLLVSTDERGGAQVDLKHLANRLSGVAHLRAMKPGPTYDLTRTVGKQMSAYHGAVRLYMPGLEQGNEDPFQHPLWLPPTSGRNPSLVNRLCERILPLGFLDEDGDARFWRVGLLRQATSRMLAQNSTGSREEQLEAELQALKDELVTSKETASSAEELMLEANVKLNAVEAENARLEDESRTLRYRIEQGRPIPNLESTTSIGVDDVRAIYDQTPTLEASLRIVSALFPERIVVLPSAFSAARDSAGFVHKSKAFDLLWKLSTDYWTALSSGQGDGTAKACFGNSYAATEATLSDAGRRRRTFSYNDADCEMLKHLKIGVKDSRFETLRVHFEWIAEEGRVVVGYCGGHLDF